MQTTRRRRWNLAALAVGAVAVGGLVAIGGVVGDAERVTQMWVGAELTTEGDVPVREVIDYDFGLAVDKHGIFRSVPGLGLEAEVLVRSESAPAGIADRSMDTSVSPPGVRLKIGDPNTTVNGRHRYRIDYRLPRSDVLDDRDTLAWDAVGTGWEVPVGVAEVHVVAPWELTGLTCSVGSAGATGGCTIRPVGPGHAVARVEGLDAHEGITVTARRGADLGAAPPLPSPPVSAPPDPGVGIAVPAAAAAVAGLGSALTTSALVRRAGRERVGAGGAADAAWAGDTPAGEVLVDEADLADLATTEYAPPGELTAAQGGVLLAERVRPEHKVAWLIQAAIDGVVDLQEEDGAPVTLTRTGELGGPYEPLATAFDGRQAVELGSYDADFAKGWTAVGAQLDEWAGRSGLWDARADQRRTGVRVLGGLVGIIGALLAFGGGFAANRWGGGWLPLVVVGALLAGGGLAAAVRGWELRRRTPEGSALWLRVESFRRFLHGSETFHAEEAARRGVLREYTAWAVALDELGRWERAVRGSTAIPAEAGLAYVAVAPSLSSATSSAATAPSSSGGGGGGSVGGGGGGGGGGSW